MARKLNQAGEELIKFYETLALQAYYCPARVPTIGWGHTRTVTADDVQQGRKITRKTAQMLFDQDVEEFCSVVETALGGVAATDNQFAAMVSLCFNIGAANFLGSSVLRLHKQGKTVPASQAFGLFVKARVNGKLVVLNGLVARRARERALYLEPAASDAAPITPMPQAIEPEKPVASSTTMIASGMTAVTAVTSVGAQLSKDLGVVKDNLGISVEYLVLLTTVFAVCSGGYLMWKRWQGRQEGRV